MKIPVVTFKSCIYISRKAKEYEINGNRGISYKLNLESPDEETGEVKCTKEAYDHCEILPKYSPVELLIELDVDNSRMVVVGVRVPDSKKDDSDLDSKKDDSKSPKKN